VPGRVLKRLNRDGYKDKTTNARRRNQHACKKNR
ncbi:hypothetical protein THOM_1120, partial [Trachipleistophora hominis]